MLVPVSLTHEDEIPLPEFLTEEHWSENYCFMGYDYETNVGIYLHIGRWAQDRTIWREQVYVYLPDGTTLNYRSLGKGDCSNGPQGALFKATCKEPGELWRIDYSGPTFKASAETLKNGPLAETIMDRMDLALEFRARGPVMMFKIVDNSTIGRWHYEQEMLLSGRVSFRGRDYVMNGRGWRDHTRGPRYLAHLRGHVNIQGEMPDEAMLSCFALWEERDGVETQIISEARIVRGGTHFVPARVIECTRVVSPDQYNDDIKLTLETENEQIALIGRPLNSFFISCNANFEFVYGVAPKLAPLATLNQAVRFTWGDKIVNGHAERSMWLAS